MKKTIAILFILMFTFSFAKEIKVPKDVQDAFSKKFVNANSVKWEKEGKDYEANFKLANQKMSILMTEKGELKETEVEIDKTKLNPKITEYINSKYPKANILEVVNVESKEKGDFIEVEFKFNNKKIELKFNLDGTLIK